MITVVVVAILLDCLRVLVYGAAIGTPVMYIAYAIKTSVIETDHHLLDHKSEEARLARDHELKLLGDGK